MEKQFLQFEETGDLEAGVHNCTWGAFQKLTFTNIHREILGQKLIDFLRWPRQMGSFPQVYIGGGFISNRPYPQDIDLVLETRHPFGRDAFAAMQPFFAKGLDEILSTYSVHLHFWMEGAPRGLSDFRSFFQYQRPQRKDCFNAKKGILRLSLLSEDFMAGFASKADPREAGKSSEQVDSTVGPHAMAA